MPQVNEFSWLMMSMDLILFFLIFMMIMNLLNFISSFPTTLLKYYWMDEFINI